MSGPLVFRVELPLQLAPTLNRYASIKRIRGKGGYRFVMHKLNDDVDNVIKVAKAQWPTWVMEDLVLTHEHFLVRGKMRTKETRTGGRRRRVVVTRHSSVEPDEVSCDVVGGKVPLDRLVQARVLVDDNRRWCEREAHWKPSPPKQGRVVVEVYEIEELKE